VIAAEHSATDFHRRLRVRQAEIGAAKRVIRLGQRVANGRFYQRSLRKGLVDSGAGLIHGILHGDLLALRQLRGGGADDAVGEEAVDRLCVLVGLLRVSLLAFGLVALTLRLRQRGAGPGLLGANRSM
jgi:hypothetical protein